VEDGERQPITKSGTERTQQANALTEHRVLCERATAATTADGHWPQLLFQLNSSCACPPLLNLNSSLYIFQIREPDKSANEEQRAMGPVFRFRARRLLSAAAPSLDG
jgi:hypothetical protein